MIHRKGNNSIAPAIFQSASWEDDVKADPAVHKKSKVRRTKKRTKSTIIGTEICFPKNAVEEDDMSAATECSTPMVNAAAAASTDPASPSTAVSLESYEPVSVFGMTFLMSKRIKTALHD